ncbi:MAG: molybdopterin-dependent oxidoreductase [candidate division KSB1 bacterium]|nr:molybdopterin-dependent oxidoreductase [candidate division KSB1 bacterium]
MSKVLGTCGFCGCGCGVFFEVENGRVIGVAPQKAHPVSAGTLCFKGWNGFKALRHPERLRRPLLRHNGHWREASWTEALQWVGQRFREVLGKYGPQAVGVIGSTKITNEEAYLLGRLARAGLGTNNVDTAVRLTHGPTLAVLSHAWGRLGPTARITSVQESDTIVVLGENPKDQAARLGSYLLRAAKDGVPFVVVDPRKTDLASFATVHLAVRPGTDALLLSGILREIVTRGLQRAEPDNLADLSRLAEPYTLERVTAECGVAAEDVRRVADLLGKARRPLVLYGPGVTGQVNGTAAVALILDLLLLLDAFRQDWVGFLPVYHSANERGVCDFGLLPDRLPGLQSLADEQIVSRLSREWGRDVPSWPGKSFGEMLRAAASGELKALYVVGENVVRLWPNPNGVRKALENLELLVVQDLFLTETAQLAHAVLPAAGYYEKEGTVTSLEGRVQVVRRVVDPPGEARPDVQIFLDLLDALGQKVELRNAAEVFSRAAQLVPGYSGLTWERVSAPGGALVDAEDLWKGARPSLLIPDLKPPAERPDADFPLLGFLGSPPFHWRTGTMVERAHTLAREYPEPEVWANPEDAQALGLRSGMPVRLVTRYGAIQRTLRVAKEIPKGALFLPVHYRNGLTVEIVPDVLEAASKTPAMRSFAAKLERLG